MIFRYIDIEDKKIFDNYINSNHLYNSSNYEKDFATLFCFSRDLGIKICVKDYAIFITCEEKGIVKFYPPIVKKSSDFIVAINEIEQYCKDNDLVFIIEGLTIEQKSFVEKESKGNYYFREDRDNYEYLYLPHRLNHYSNSLQHYKIEQLKAFDKRVPHEYKDYVEEDYKDVEQLFSDWLGKRNISEYDYLPMITALKNYKQLGLIITCLYTGDKLIGISIAHIDNNNVGTLLFEKAEHKYFGSYANMVSYFSSTKLKDCKYINRQEDMGIEGLRNSKLSYLVDCFIDKYVLTKGFSYNI